MSSFRLIRAIRLATTAGAIFVIAACSQESVDQSGASQPAAQNLSTQQTAATPASATLGLGVELQNMDTNVRPQDDFYRYVNGGWDDRTQIPEDRSRWGSFDELRETAEQRVLAIINDFSRPGAAQTAEQQKIADVYQSFMDEAAIASLGLQPLQADLQAIAALSDHDALLDFWAQAPGRGLAAPLGFGVSQDQRQSDSYITTLAQSGLGMPDRDYYLSDNARFAEIRDLYRAHIAELLQLAGHEDAQAAAQRIVDTETRLAEAQWTRVQNRDRNATYNRMTPQELAEQVPGIDWLRYIDSTDLPSIDALVVRQPTYLQALAEMHRDISMQAWRDYHHYHLIRSAAPYLTDDFVQAHHDFFGQELSGLQALKARDRRAVDLVDRLLGFAVGRIYVERHFQQDAKDRMDDLVQNLLAQFEVAIDNLEWMSADTKVEAQAKLARLNTKIAYPDVWRDYECLQTAPDQLLHNIMSAGRCEFERSIARLGQPVDRQEWFMTPQTVNAYYSPTMNEIVFPAGILQPPFFNVEADDAVNYGAIGAVIGHEITHGFDDQGRRSDGEGNLRDWWAEQDEEQFRERAQRMIEQFDAYEPIEGMNIQGALALGENIADLGGLTVAFQAWQRSLQGAAAPAIGGFSGEQRFFLGYGQIWRTLYREEAMRRQLTTGPHSPGMYRVRGTLSNMPEFYQAFDVREGDGMYRAEDVRVKIW
jgi:putative endopeptidase